MLSSKAHNREKKVRKKREWKISFLCVLLPIGSRIYRYKMKPIKHSNQILNTNIFKPHK